MDYLFIVNFFESCQDLIGVRLEFHLIFNFSLSLLQLALEVLRVVGLLHEQDEVFAVFSIVVQLYYVFVVKQLMHGTLPTRAFKLVLVHHFVLEDDFLDKLLTRVDVLSYRNFGYT